MKLILAAAGLAAVALPATQAVAQANDTVRIRLGAGAQIRPEWPGAENTEVAFYPDVSVATGGRPFGVGAPDDGLSIKLLRGERFAAGPVLNIASGRDKDEVGVPLDKVGTTVEAGAFAQYYVSDNLRLRGELRQGIGGHDGLVGQAGADYVWRDGDRYAFTIGPRVLFASGKHQRAFFEVTPEDSLATGLPAYRPDGGIYGVAATTGLQYSLGGNWGLFGFARYERLVGDARKSPIVRELGSPNQFSAGLGVNYVFALRL